MVKFSIPLKSNTFKAEKMRLILLIALNLLPLTMMAQDSIYARKIVKELSSPAYWGRGYTKNGVNKASIFLLSELEKLSVKPLHSTGYLQNYTFPVNTFPGKMSLILNGVKLIPGKDFIINPESNSSRFKGLLKQTDSLHYLDSAHSFRLSLAKKLTWSVSTKVRNHASVVVLKDRVPRNNLLPYQIEVESKFIDDFPASNICGIIHGQKQPDSLIVLTAHYDHLGGMGNHVYFPGANDNASGVSMLLSLARYYQENQPDYSIVFLFFSGEEAGLIGSRYFVENPLINLNRIKFLLNLDLTGTGEEGITVVNATEHNRHYNLLNSINSENKYLSKIKSRGKAANSDHYYFSEQGVPSFFIYTNGGIKAYHDIYDRSETLPLTEFEDLFKLIRDFVAKMD